MSDRHVRLSPAQVETIAGLSAGIISTLVVHPLDVIKTRLQIHRSASATPISSLSLLRTLARNEHPIQSFYRGLSPNLLGNASSWALFFYFKSMFETQLRRCHGRNSNGTQISQQSLSTLDYFISSGLSGLAINVVTNPIWVLKTRMLSSDRSAVGAYPTMWIGSKAVYRHEGWRGFYKGLGISCLGVFHGAVQFAVYESLKKKWQNRVAHNVGTETVGSAAKLDNTATLVISGVAKVAAGVVMYPYQVVRSRLQTYDAEARFGKGTGGVVKKVWLEEGWRGFYRGLGPNVVRVLPATWVTFLVYENVRYELPRILG